jgi:hypothetical protein
MVSARELREHTAVVQDTTDGIVNLTGFAHLSGISGLRQVTGFQGLSFCGNDLKQPTSAQVDDASRVVWLTTRCPSRLGPPGGDRLLRARPEKGLSGQGSRDSKRVLKPNLEARDVDPDHSAAV